MKTFMCRYTVLVIVLVCIFTVLSKVEGAQKTTLKPDGKVVATTPRVSNQRRMKMLFYSKCILPNQIPLLKDMAAKANAECLPTELATKIGNSPENNGAKYYNPCSMVCYLQKHGFITKLRNESYNFNIPAIQTFMDTHLMEGAREGFDKELQECSQKKGLSTSFAVNTNDKCLASKAHVQCFVKATEKSCKTIIAKNNPSNKTNRLS